jgi:hypothetical protein
VPVMLSLWNKTRLIILVLFILKTLAVWLDRLGQLQTKQLVVYQTRFPIIADLLCPLGYVSSSKKVSWSNGPDSAEEPKKVDVCFASVASAYVFS